MIYFFQVPSAYPLKIYEEVLQALNDKKCGIVALESTVITHGMSYPENLQ